MENESKIENHPDLGGKRLMLKGLKENNLETFDDIWNMCVRKGTEELSVLPNVGRANILSLLTATIQYQADKNRKYI